MNSKQCSCLCAKAWSIVLAAAMFFSVSGILTKNQTQLTVPKKKIIVLTSPGGGGHTSASNAIREYLKDDYDVTIAPILEILQSFDAIQLLTFRYYSAEGLYNYLIANNWFWLTNKLFFTFGAWYMQLQFYSMGKALIKYFKYNQYDMIISVVPVFNNPLLRAAEKYNIPILVVPTDLDATLFAMGLDNPTYKKFHYCLTFNDEEMRKKIEDAHISPEHMSVSGFPLRPNFFKYKDITGIKREFDIPVKKPIVMIMMGAAGSRACYKYVRQISKSPVPMHLIVCTGRNEEIRKKIAALTLPDHITITLLGFTDRISDFMAISDVLITKTGTVSFCEGLYMNIPMLLDNTSGALAWEELNIGFLKRNKLGDVITNFKELNPLLETYVKHPEYRTEAKKNLKALEKNDFGNHLKKVVHDLLCIDSA